MINTPTPSLTSNNLASQQSYQKPKYDSDDQSSMMSEPGSPQDIIMSDEDVDDETATFSQSPEEMIPPTSRPPSSPWRGRLAQVNQRVPTPIQPPNRPGARPVQVRIGTNQHVRQRHPQENVSSSSDHLEVPSPIDEDEVPTPPSAAEAAGSQLSMLTVSDVDMEPTESLPSISVDASESLQLAQGPEQMDSAIDVEPMDSIAAPETGLVVRKQRQRSGALSSGHGSPSPSPMRVDPSENGRKRGFSMGFRTDCEKCRMRVPGHMNHFIS